MQKKIKILLMLFCLYSFIFAWNSHCFYDGYFCAAEGRQSSFVLEKLREKSKKINENKKKYVWQKRGRYQLSEYEKLTYTILWNSFPAGNAALELRGFNNINGRKAHHIYFYAATNLFFDSFYSICRGSDAKQRQFDFYSSGQEYLFYDGGLTPEGNVDEYM